MAGRAGWIYETVVQERGNRRACCQDESFRAWFGEGAPDCTLACIYDPECCIPLVECSSMRQGIEISLRRNPHPPKRLPLLPTRHSRRKVAVMGHAPRPHARGIHGVGGMGAAAKLSTAAVTSEPHARAMLGVNLLERHRSRVLIDAAPDAEHVHRARLSPGPSHGRAIVQRIRAARTREAWVRGERDMYRDVVARFSHGRKENK